MSRRPRDPNEPSELDNETMLKIVLEASRKLRAQEAAETDLPARLPEYIYDPGWMRIASSGYGATLEAVWHSSWSIIGVTVALIWEEQPAGSYQRIPYRKLMSKPDLVETVVGISEKPAPDAMMTVLVQLGPDTGHAITIVEVDRTATRITYQDPENFRDPKAPSLLCQGNNSIGVAAKPARGRPGGWTISFDEFETALVAAYVKPSAYARLLGIEYRRSLESVTEDEFGNFFHLTLLKPMGGKKAGTSNARLGAHKDDIHLQFEVDPSGYIQRATLAVSRPILQGPNRSLALDAIKSFIPAMVPVPDVEEASLLSQAIWGARRGLEEAESELGQGPAHLVPQVREVWDCLVGKLQAAQYWLPLTTIAAANVKQGQQWWFRLLVALSELKGGYMFGPEDAAATKL